MPIEKKPHISPSSIRTGFPTSGCAAQMLGRVSDGAARLPSSAHGFVGTALHDLIEAAGGGMYPAQAIQFIQNEYSLNGVPIAFVLPKSDRNAQSSGWRSKVKVARKVAEEEYDKAMPNTAYALRPKHWTAFPSKHIRHSDVPYELYKPDLQNKTHYELTVAVNHDQVWFYGKMDKVKQDDRHIEITDFKTGSIFKEGEVDPNFKIQLNLYAWMLKQRYPSASISLVLNGKTRHSWKYNARSTNALVEQLIQEYKKPNLSFQTTVSHLDSRTKEERTRSPCQNCYLRHECSEYKGKAPSWWRGTKHYIPLDVWGTIIHLNDTQSQDWIDVVVRAEDGREVNIRHVPRSVLDGKSVGDAIECYSLFYAKGNGRSLPSILYVGPQNSKRKERPHQSFNYLIQ